MTITRLPAAPYHSGVRFRQISHRCAKAGISALMASVAPAALAQNAVVTPVPEMSQSLAISRDRTVFLGLKSAADFGTNGLGRDSRAIRRAADGSKLDLGVISGSPGASVAIDTKHNGSVVAGYSSISAHPSDTPQYKTYIDGYNVRAFRWTSATGLQDLGTIGGFSGSSQTPAQSAEVGVSADGLIIAGTSDFAVGASGDACNLQHAFRWTSAGGMQDLGGFGPGLSPGAAGSLQSPVWAKDDPVPTPRSKHRS